MAPPRYQHVVDTIVAEIAAGVLKPGDALPSIAQLADRFDTSQTTIKTALVALRARGVVEGQQGKGVFVAES